MGGEVVKEIITDKAILQLECTSLDCTPSTWTDSLHVKQVVEDLQDTAKAHKQKCLGLAANQIHELDPIFVFKVGALGMFVPILNPKVISVGGGMKNGSEGCLSLPGEVKMVRRHKEIKIQYFDWLLEEEVIRKFKGLEARIIQHELDHLRGILI